MLPAECLADELEVVEAVAQRVVLDEELAGERRILVERDRGRRVELRVAQGPHRGGRGPAVLAKASAMAVSCDTDSWALAC